jgi:hypothetical protein
MAPMPRRRQLFKLIDALRIFSRREGNKHSLHAAKPDVLLGFIQETNAVICVTQER